MKTPLAAAITKVRKAAGLTQEKVAQKSGLAVRTVRLIEGGDVDPRCASIEAISHALGISPLVIHGLAMRGKGRKDVLTRLFYMFHSNSIVVKLLQHIALQRAETEYHVGYMCYVDYHYELGQAGSGNRVYPSIKDLKYHHECWADCGIVEVSVTLCKTLTEPGDKRMRV